MDLRMPVLDGVATTSAGIRAARGHRPRRGTRRDGARSPGRREAGRADAAPLGRVPGVAEQAGLCGHGLEASRPGPVGLPDGQRPKCALARSHP
jgi:hypothetical protein